MTVSDIGKAARDTVAVELTGIDNAMLEVLEIIEVCLRTSRAQFSPSEAFEIVENIVLRLRF